MKAILPNIKEPKDVRALNLDELEKLSKEIRDFLISSIAKTGGHLSSNLGAVELTLALHYVWESPKDRIIWDTGHQCYVHKIITGRQEGFKALRKYKGLSGFPKRKESKHDIFEPGHSSTSVSAALGIAKARDFRGEDFEVIAMIGDGALTAGEAYEGLNNLGNEETNVAVILNDNKMSISPNIGAVAEHLKRLSEIKVEGMERGELRSIFENLNFVYLGPIDGHNFQSLISAFKRAKKIKGPKIIHVLTKKGRGFKVAEDDAVAYHSACTYDPERGIQDNHSYTYTDVFSKTIAKLAAKNKKIIGITAAMVCGVGLNEFSLKYPDRFFDVGIAEQHAVTFAAGMAMEGFRPFFAVYSTFLQRAYDQIIIDVAQQQLPVVFMLDRSGLSGKDGPTHEGVYDMSWLRSVPNLVIMAPKDADEFQDMIKTAEQYVQGPIAIRYPKEPIKEVKIKKSFRRLPIGKGEKISEGRDLTIVALGSTVKISLEAQQTLHQQGINATLLNLRFLKPIDKQLILDNIVSKKVLVVEDNSEIGGLYGAILELFQNNNIRNVEVSHLGIPDKFVEQGELQILREKFNLTPEGVIAKAKELVK